jgi:hypothetical protein
MFVAEDQPRMGVEIMANMKSFADKVRDQATGDSAQARRKLAARPSAVVGPT